MTKIKLNIFVPIIAAAMGLSACSSDGGADKDGDGEISAKEAQDELASGGAIQMKPGEYEMKITFTELDAPGLPDAGRSLMEKQMKDGLTVKNCMTQEQLENPGTEMFGGTKEDGCKLNKLDRSGNNMTVSMSCDQPGGLKMESNMKGSFAASSYAMEVEQKMTGSPIGDMSMKGKIEAKLVGNCPS